MRTLFYVLVYGFFGYILERIINLVAYGTWFDNRVLTLPIQPMYGVGIVLAIIVFRLIKRFPIHSTVQVLLVFFVAILTTALSEWVSGEGYLWLHGTRLWDYGDTFPMCGYPFVCWLPTTLFGILSGLVVLCIHPLLEPCINKWPKWVLYGVLSLFFLDVAITYASLVSS
ncbi:MAG: putative ABC transporter permease [Candidatus Izemoplasmataceae bacterium]